jgi:hypothetical protein
LDSWFKSYGVFKTSTKVLACYQPLPNCQCNKICPKLPKSAQIYQNMTKDNKFKKLWNTSKNWDFGIFLKQKLLCVEGAPRHVYTVWIFNTRTYHMPFSLSKNGLCMWISAYFFVQDDVFLKVPYVSWVWDFVEMYLTDLETSVWSPSIHTYSRKWFFWPPKVCCILWAQGKNPFFSNFEYYNLTIGMEWMCKIRWTYRQTS